MSEIEQETEVKRELLKDFDRDARTSDYCCIPCGRTFLTEKQLADGGGAHTAHVSKCGACGEETTVLHIRIYNWLFKPKTEKK